MTSDGLASRGPARAVALTFAASLVWPPIVRPQATTDSVAAHFVTLASTSATVTCMTWSDPKMEVRRHPVSSGCLAETGDTTTYFYRTEVGDLFAVVRTIRLDPDSSHTTSAHTESALIATYGMPEACNVHDWRFIFDVAKVLRWRRAGYTVTFQTTEGGGQSDENPERRRTIVVQIARGERSCADIVDPPALE